MKRKFFILATIFLCAILFNACSAFDAEPEEFLEDYGSVAYIVGASGNGTWIEKNGWVNISSEGMSEDYIVIFNIENSSGYELDCEITFPEGCVFENLPYTCLPNSISISFSQSVLESIDGNLDANNISPTIKLFRKDDGRPQSVYSLKMRCNSPPVKITNALSQMLSSDQQLVIAFDMPEIASDVNLFTIEANGVKHNFDIVNGVPVAAGGEAWIISNIQPSDMVSTHPDVSEVFATQGGTPYYVITDITGLLGLPLFDVNLILTDRGGLTSNTSIPSRILKLDRPYSSSDGIENIAQDAEQDYGTFIIYPPIDHPDATVHYAITDGINYCADVTGSTESHVGSTEFHLYPEVDGSAKTYIIENAYASLTGYLNSENNANAMGNSGVLTIEGSQLSEPTSNGTIFTQNDEGYAEYILTAKEGSIISYTIEKGGNYETGNGISPVTVKLPHGIFNITAQTTKPFHRDSYALNETGVTVEATVMYVSASGSDSTGDGTKGNPYATIAKACSEFTTPSSILNTVYLLSDLDATDNLAPALCTVKIAGCKDGSIGSVATIKCNTANSAFNVANGNITLQNVNFAQSAGNTGSAISVAGGSLVLWNSTISGITASNANKGAVRVTDGDGTFTVRGKVRITGNSPANVYLADSKVINIDSSGINGSSIGVTTATAPSSSTPEIIITNGYGNEHGLDYPSAYFSSDNNYGLKLYNSEVRIVASTGNIGTNVPETLTFALSSISGSGGTITVNATGNVNGIITSGITWILMLYFGSDSTPIISTTNSITIPSNYQSGTYVIEVTAIYKGTTYSDSLTYTKN